MKHPSPLIPGLFTYPDHTARSRLTHIFPASQPTNTSSRFLLTPSTLLHDAHSPFPNPSAASLITGLDRPATPQQHLVRSDDIPKAGDSPSGRHVLPTHSRRASAPLFLTYPRLFALRCLPFKICGLYINPRHVAPTTCDRESVRNRTVSRETFLSKNHFSPGKPTVFPIKLPTYLLGYCERALGSEFKYQ